LASRIWQTEVFATRLTVGLHSAMLPVMLRFEG